MHFLVFRSKASYPERPGSGASGGVPIERESGDITVSLWRPGMPSYAGTNYIVDLMSNANKPKKNHHYVPVTYLKAFRADDGMVSVYRKDAPERPYRQIPEEVGFRRYYYAQPLEGGGRDTNRLEDQFSKLETKWPAIVQQMSRAAPVNDKLEDIFSFIALQRARVPAARDAAERMLAAFVTAETRQLQAAGKLPPPPKGFENILDHAVVSIDPHQSIHAMVDIIRAMGEVFNRIGLSVLRNLTDVEFVTSDNPVLYFDPAKSSDDMLPYTLQESGDVVLMMPVSPALMIFGTSWDKSRFASEGLGYGDLDDVAKVKQMNETVIRFSYAAIFARSRPDLESIRKHAHLSPVLKAERVTRDGKHGIWLNNVFGAREPKPKWKDRV